MAKKKKQRKLSYWEGRSVGQEEYVFQGLKPKEKKISKAYIKAQQYLTAESRKIYDRYLNKSGMSEDEVKRILNTSVEPTAIVELQRLTKTVQDKEIKKQMTDYLDGLAVKHRISRLEDLKAKSFLVSKQVADVQLQTSTDYFIDVIKDGYEQSAAEGIIGKTDQLIKEGFELRDWNKGSPKVLPKMAAENTKPSYSIKDGKPVIEIYDWNTQKVVHTIEISPNKPLVEFKQLSTKYVNNILESHWMGSNYSKRIWNDTELLAKKVEELFTVEAMTGMSERDMANALMNEFNVGYNIAKRLIRTEANYMAGQAKLKGWKEHGVEEYVIVAVLDLRTSQTCQDQDGEIYKVAEAICNGKFGNYPPFHPWCRTVVRAYFGKASLQGNRTAVDPITDKRFKILQSDTYKKWEDMLIREHGKEDYELFRRMAKAFGQDKQQLEKMQKVLKAEAPKTIEEFQEIKYKQEDQYKDLKKRFAKASMGEREKLTNTPNADVDWKEVNSQRFRNKFDIATDNPEVKAALVDESRRILKSRDGSMKETYSLIDRKTGAVKTFENSKIDKGIDAETSRSVNTFLKDNKEGRFISVHNHPENYPPSISDIATLRTGYRKRIEKGLIVGHKGRVNLYTKPEIDIPLKAKKILDVYRKMGYTELTAQVKFMEELSAKYKFEMKGEDF